jgi:hypothetical protein
MINLVNFYPKLGVNFDNRLVTPSNGRHFRFLKRLCTINKRLNYLKATSSTRNASNVK